VAMEGGICYWCRKAEVVGEYLGEYASDQISRGGALILHDAESAQTWELTLEKFLNGVKLYFEQGCHVNVEDNAIDTCDIDANDAASSSSPCLGRWSLDERLFHCGSQKLRRGR